MPVVSCPLFISNFVPQRSLTQLCWGEKKHDQICWKRRWRNENVEEWFSLTCPGVCGSYGCCIPTQEGLSPHPQEPENNMRWAQSLIQKHFYLLNVRPRAPSSGRRAASPPSKPHHRSSCHQLGHPRLETLEWNLGRHTKTQI